MIQFFSGTQDRLPVLKHFSVNIFFFFRKIFCIISILLIMKICLTSNPGSLPPSPADSGVSDVDSSSSGGQPCSEELKARLGLPPHVGPQNVSSGPFLNPNYYHNPTHLRNIWSNRNVQRK